jgi:methylenetetrahydrofolate dehydrogenase (NADP+)/methenyltetrahydrofolate cyclohydrolase
MDPNTSTRTAPTDPTEGAATVLDGNPVADRIHDDLGSATDSLRDSGVAPAVALVSMTDSGAGRTYVSMKEQACATVGVESTVHRIDPDRPAAALFELVADLNDDPAVHGVSVQSPLPDHVGPRAVARRIDPEKDVEGVHPENLGRLLAGTPRYTPPTAAGIVRLLDAYGIDTAGKRAVVVGRSEAVGRPTAVLLSGHGPGGDATTTVCHSRTADLAAATRSGDIVVVAAGRPGLVDGEMLSAGAVVVDVGINRVGAGDGDAAGQVAGDVDFESARRTAAAITPVPGGVGPLSVAMLLCNAVDAASRHAGVDVALP